MSEPQIIIKESNADVPKEALSNPALLFLYYRIEQILGIKSSADCLIKLNNYLEEKCGASFVNDPASYEFLLTSREQIYSISNFLTINETYFFRESAHFDLLNNILPVLVKEKKSLKLCSAATSIGCEAYSLAMFLDYHKRKGLNFDYSIDAFDINAQSIETAKNAHYTPNAVRTDGADYRHILDSYLVIENGEYIISQNIRAKVNFFNHNVMRGLDRLYDIIFFRNSLIYFSLRNRYYVMNNLVESLAHNGLLFLGISETASVKHHLLVSRYFSDVFYFQKTGVHGLLERLPDNCMRKIDINNYYGAENINSDNSKRLPVSNNARQNETSLDFTETAEILKINEKEQDENNIIKMLSERETEVSSLSGSQITAYAIYLLNTENFEEADKIISIIEENYSGSFVFFLRGEYFFLRGSSKEAEKYYEDASAKDKYFWPAFYRIQGLAAKGNKTRYKYKIRKAIESIELVKFFEGGENHNYECFMGGFSPDYFLRILEKKQV